MKSGAHDRKGLNCTEDDGKVEDSDDAILSQLVKLQMVEGLPGANDSDVWRQKDTNMSSMNGYQAFIYARVSSLGLFMIIQYMS